MNKTLVILFALLFFQGCGGTCRYLKPFDTSVTLDKTLPVLVATPKNGWYGGRQYKNSGEATAREIKRVISLYAAGPVTISDCNNITCLDDQTKNSHRYYFVSEILHWENRATAYTFRPDRLIIQLDVYDLKTGEKLNSFTSKSRSAILFTARNTPFALIRHPVNIFIRSLYRIGQN